MKRICIGLLTSLGCIAVATALIVRPFSKKSIQSYVLRNQDELTNYARKVIEEHPMGPLEWNGWKVYYYADDMVEFCTGSFGLIPSTTYKGFYYSEDDEPHGFQDVPVEFVKSGNGWSWAESEGDNAVYLYDEKVLITFNYKDGTKTITFDEIAAKDAPEGNGSDLGCFAP